MEAGAREKEKKLLALRDQLILQHDEALLRAENDKQQALLMGGYINSINHLHLENVSKSLYKLVFFEKVKFKQTSLLTLSIMRKLTGLEIDNHV